MDISSVALVCVEHTVTFHVTLHCLQMQANNMSHLIAVIRILYLTIP